MLLALPQVQLLPLRTSGEVYRAAKREAPTFLEVGEEEIKAQVTAVFAVAP